MRPIMTFVEPFASTLPQSRARSSHDPPSWQVRSQTRATQSIDKIDAKEMQDQTTEDVIRKRPVIQNKQSAPARVHVSDGKDEANNAPLMPDTFEFFLVLRVRLDAQTSRQDELTDRGREAGKESVERLLGFLTYQHSITSRTLRFPFSHPFNSTHLLPLPPSSLSFLSGPATNRTPVQVKG